MADRLGVQDFGAIIAIITGLNILPTNGKFANAMPGTSLASHGARNLFGNAKFPWELELPSVIAGYPPHRLKILMTHKIITFIGRAIPVVGWVILANDIFVITYQTIREYHFLARGMIKYGK